jgi:Bacterial regulatory protein, Fis family/Calcineurin-like phosphoesterase
MPAGGFSPELTEVELQKTFDTLTRNKGNKSATARELGITRNTLDHRLARYAQRSIAPPPSPDPIDPIEIRRYRDHIANLQTALRAAEQRAADAEDLRRDVLGMRDLPPVPVNFPQPETSAGHAETAILLLSDLHWSERASLEALDGLNSYNLEIARNRLGRWAHAAADLLTLHWSGTAPDRIILVLGGDLISGGIHPEFLKTDELQPIPAVRDCAHHLRAALLIIRTRVNDFWSEKLKSPFRVPLDVISLPGNHGRSTPKPESKESSTTSHDVLVSDFLEMSLLPELGITFFAPPSPDALFSVYGWHVLATHGDRIGSRGGQGFVGPAATAARGMKRVVADYAARGVHIDLVLVCHFHTRLLLEEGAVNGSLIGPTEFSRDGRYRPLPAVQLFLTVHPRRLMAQIRWIEVGHPDEGSLYEPPPPDRPLRPRYRV